jgi:hypothetical protein
MALTGLLVVSPHYRSIFPSTDSTGRSDSPGVRNLQVWMEQAWNDGELRLTSSVLLCGRTNGVLRIMQVTMFKVAIS